MFPSTGVNGIDLIQPDSMVVQPGQPLTITCQVSGYSLTDSSYATDSVKENQWTGFHICWQRSVICF
ncbi:hypothetical protein F7725_003615 [Dissostichus mawsoni]|uniref:Ig-like domain-containing protein n=1 Tax=Dissostichus mawsoni TaxID=36200 RepID=A0A7J5YDE0_DISMA|nr:hypothetical protein F7725_003615 [Dissostichus mawsoni]